MATKKRSITVHLSEPMAELIDHYTATLNRSDWIVARIVESLYLEKLLGRREYDRIVKTMRVIHELPEEKRALRESDMRKVVHEMFVEWMRKKHRSGGR